MSRLALPPGAFDIDGGSASNRRGQSEGDGVELAGCGGDSGRRGATTLALGKRLYLCRGDHSLILAGGRPQQGFRVLRAVAES